jgi:flagellar biogenesis protein FliO
VSPYASYIVETFLTLLAVCALAFVVLYGARRLGVGRATGPIRLYAHLPLDRRRAIYVIKVGTQAFVVGVGEAGFTKLGEMPASDLPADAAPETGSFAAALARALGRGQKETPHE